MGSLLSRWVKFHISNQTRNITLKLRRDFFECGHFSSHPLPELSRGSSDTFNFSGDFWLWGVAGLLVYEAESFTLAIYFSNPIDYNKFSMELGLELSPGKVHLDTLETTYVRMARGTYCSSWQDSQFARAVLSKTLKGEVALRHGPVLVKATMSGGGGIATLMVTLEEQRGMREEPGGECFSPGRHYQEN